MEEERNIIEVCQNIQTFADAGKWDQYLSCFTDEILIDYFSFFGAPPQRITKEVCMANAKMALPKFHATMHFMTNFKTQIKGDKATAQCYVEALHVVKGAPGGDSLTLFGIYDFAVVKTAQGWKVDAMKFTFKHQEGNKDLFLISAKS